MYRHLSVQVMECNSSDKKWIYCKQSKMADVNMTRWLVHSKVSVLGDTSTNISSSFCDWCTKYFVFLTYLWLRHHGVLPITKWREIEALLLLLVTLLEELLHAPEQKIKITIMIFDTSKHHGNHQKQKNSKNRKILTLWSTGCAVAIFWPDERRRKSGEALRELAVYPSW